ncbi:MAG: hypothetical protein JWR38_2165 [Mucilaginibacter sp.]|nr:hypothetical protein [Mucilaginibacter sp.]
MTLSNIGLQLKLVEQKPLSGGVIARNLKIKDNGMGMLELSGNITITIKVLNLCSTLTLALPFLITSTKQLITSLLKGPVYSTGNNYYKYNSSKHSFDTKTFWTYSILYNFTFNIDVFQVHNINEIRGNDFVIATVDDISMHFKDTYGKVHELAGVAFGSGTPAFVIYNY